MKLSFRAKLILAMTLIVTCVTGATLWGTQRRVRATYQHLFEEQFGLQINYFAEKRIEQLEAVAAQCDALAKSVRVRAAMESVVRGEFPPDMVYGDIDTALQQVKVDRNAGQDSKALSMRKITGNIRYPQRGKGQLIPQRGGRPEDAPKGRPPPNPSLGNMGEMRDKLLGGLPTMTLLGPDGKVLLASSPGILAFRRPMPGDNRVIQNTLESLFAKQKASDLEEQEIGYVSATPDGRDDPTGKKKDAELRELIVTPLQNNAEPPEHLGALVIGFPVHDFGEGQMYEFSENKLRSGIWLDGKIHSKTIPAEVRSEISTRIAEAVKSGGAVSEQETIVLDGVPHLLFYKLLNPDSIFAPAAQVCLYSMSEAVGEQAAARMQILTLGGLALLVGIGFILRISHGFSKPVEALAKATQRVSDGDFNVKVPVTTKDELGTLAASFNHMTEELALKERYKTVLAQVTDKEVAEQLISGQMALGGEVKQVSVLFCDIRGFTALTENMPPAEVITMLNEHMTAMNRIVHKHYGVVDKFVGDLIMAVFGAPKSYGNDALHAVKCALKMMEERKRLNETTKHSFEIGIGVASGEVVAGCMGSDDRLNYTVLGDRVNLASRLCSKAGKTELLIDENTYNLLPPAFIVEATEPMPLKGFSNLVPAYRLLEMDDSAVIESESEPQPEAAPQPA